MNALELYDQITGLNPCKEKDLLRAHKILMKGLIENAGRYRLTAIGIVKGSKVSRIAPPAKQVGLLMSELFEFHYELELIHPFTDGNGRMGRLWQQRFLTEDSSVFEFLAVESLIHHHQKKYYEALEKSDVAGNSTLFIEFSLKLILAELKKFCTQFHPPKLTSRDRIAAAIEHFGNRAFSRKEYQALHKEISAPTASRDLAEGVHQKNYLGRAKNPPLLIKLLNRDKILGQMILLPIALAMTDFNLCDKVHRVFWRSPVEALDGGPRIKSPVGIDCKRVQI